VRCKQAVCIIYYLVAPPTFFCWDPIICCTAMYFTVYTPSSHALAFAFLTYWIGRSIAIHLSSLWLLSPAVKTRLYWMYRASSLWFLQEPRDPGHQYPRSPSPLVQGHGLTGRWTVWWRLYNPVRIFINFFCWYLFCCVQVVVLFSIRRESLGGGGLYWKATFGDMFFTP
jgi:hypothetical protein